ncbi:MAG: exonuclease SbcD [Oleispira sp.]|jgi:exonuclease SbcD
MRILHTSDWHLGQFFINKSRLPEHQKFITWLLETVVQENIDAVIIAGDIFDTGSPPSYARELYNQFVIGMNQLGRQLVILAGNHDSVSTLNESKNILAQLNTRVIAAAADCMEEQVIELNDQQGEVAAILCAIPYLRPKDIMKSSAGESGDQKKQALGQAIGEHYQTLFAMAEKRRAAIGKPLPIIATGHLAAMGVTASESVRDIYVGSLEAFPASAFPPADYIALGHIHRSQIVAKSDHIRYCGSPIPLSFDELGRQKQVLIVEFNDGVLTSVTPSYVPLFQPMMVIKGDLESIEQQLIDFSKSGEEPLATWLSIEVETQDYLNDLQQRVQVLTAGMNVEILQLRRAKKQQQKRIEGDNKEVLAELSPMDVFERRLALEEFVTPDDQSRLKRLRQTFEKTVIDIEQELTNES